MFLRFVLLLMHGEYKHFKYNFNIGSVCHIFAVAYLFTDDLFSKARAFIKSGNDYFRYCVFDGDRKDYFCFRDAILYMEIQ